MWNFDTGSFILGCLVAAAFWAPVIYGAEKKRIMQQKQNEALYSSNNTQRWIR